MRRHCGSLLSRLIHLTFSHHVFISFELSESSFAAGSVEVDDVHYKGSQNENSDALVIGWNGVIEATL